MASKSQTQMFEALDLSRKDDIRSYFERYELFCVVQGIKDNMKVSMLLASIRGEAFTKLEDLLTPHELSACTYEEIKKTAADHFEPKPVTAAERHNFRSRIQAEGESFNDFLTEIKKLSKHCGFQGEERLKEELIDQIIKGIGDERTRSYFLSTPDLTLQQVINKALADEKAKASTAILKTSCNNKVSETQVDKITVKDSKKQFYKTEKKAGTEKHVSKPRYNDRGSGKFSVSNRCGRNGHVKENCRLDRNIKCFNCDKIGHTSKVCRAPKREKKNEANLVYINDVNCINGNFIKKWRTLVKINHKSTMMEIDTGSPISLISLNNFRKVAPGVKMLDKVRTTFVSYTHDKLQVPGKSKVTVQYKNQVISEDLYIVNGDVSTLLGREWLLKIKLDWTEIHQIKVNKRNVKDVVNRLIDEYSEIFKEKIGYLKDVTANIEIKTDSRPIHMSARTIPFAMRNRVNAEIERLEKAGIIEKVKFSEWTTPIVPILKVNGKDVRICGDYKVTINKNIIPEQYPMPHIEQILASMHDARFFAKFDIREAYLHMPTNKKTSGLLTITTPKGLFRVKRMLYGVTNAPAIWQKVMDDLFKHIDGISVFYDVKITASTENEFIERIKQFFTICRENGIKLKKEKCNIDCEKIDYLGYLIDKLGLHKTTEKITAIINARKPTNITEIKSFVGLVNYYNRFIPNAAKILHPIYELLKKGNQFNWNKACDHAFQAIKTEIASDRVLCLFDPSKTIVLTTDTSPYGIGATLSHRFEDGNERPVAFVSKRLNATKRNYSQIDKEAMAIVWAIKRFFNYLYGNKFILLTDHKPLKSIFSPHASLPVLSATRMLHYAVFLSGFSYEIKYRRTDDHANTDFCSRFPVDREDNEYWDEPRIFEVNQIAALPVTSKEIARETLKDKELIKLYNAIKSGDGQINVQGEFAIQQGCLMKGIRVVIPESLKTKILNELHAGHMGIVKMKALARFYCYWKGIDDDINRVTKQCIPCINEMKEQKRTPIHPWEFPMKPWQRIHIDFAGPCMGAYFLVVVDAYGPKWVEIYTVNRITSAVTIKCLKDCFARFGLPVTIVSDNGPSLVSEEFKLFLNENGIKHIRTAPYHPNSNGQAERYVQILKNGLKKTISEKGNIQTKIADFLMRYRLTPHAATNLSPAELMFNRKNRSRLDLIIPNLNNKMNEYNLKMYNKSKTLMRKFQIGDKVQIRSYNREQKWLSSIIIEVLGSCMYRVKCNGNVHTRHIDQMFKNENEMQKDNDIGDTHSEVLEDSRQYEPPRELRRSNRIKRQPSYYVSCDY